MFWKSIAEGTAMLLTHWEIWAGIFLFGIIFISYFLLLGLVLTKNEGKGGVQLVGCLTHIIAGPALQGILVAFLVTAILPILCGGHDFIPFSFLTEYWWQIMKAGLWSMLITIILTLIPIMGKFISDTPGTAIFVQGAIVFKLLANQVLDEVFKTLHSNANVFPSFWASFGFLVFSIVIVYMITVGLILLLTRLNIIDEYAMESMGFVIGNFIGVLPGVLCLCIYTSYIRLTILFIDSTVAI